MKGVSSLAVCLGVITVVAGCEEKTRQLRGQFDVVRSLTDTLPLIAMRDTLCTHTLMSGSLTFADDSTYSSSLIVAHECHGYENIENDDLGVKHAKYRMLGDTAIMYNDQGSVTGYGMWRGTDTIYVGGPVHTLVFVRRR